MGRGPGRPRVNRRRPRVPVSGLLVCAECVRVSDEGARAWRAFLVGGLDGEPVEIVILCPGCAEREGLLTGR